MRQLDRLPFAPGRSAAGDLPRRQAGGSSGILLATLFTAAGRAFAQGAGWAGRGDRTLIDALEPALDVLAAGGTLLGAAAAARKGAEETRSMEVARAGRSA